MSADSILETVATADLPWQGRDPVRGTLRLDRDALVLQPRPARASIRIPLAAVTRTAVETTLGMLPALQVWHRLRGEEVRSRFEFVDDEDEAAGGGPDLANRVGPGFAREAASIMEGGLRALGGGLRGGKRAMRQVAEGIARQEEYRLWADAIGMAQAALARQGARYGGPAGSAEPAGQAPTTAPPPPLVPYDAEPPRGEASAGSAWFNAHALRWLLACGARARELGVPGVPVIQPAYPLDSPTLRIVVAGEFSRGKSTVINALFGIHGEIALPTGMTPTTPLACAIRVPNLGESDGATLTYRTDRPPLHLSLEEFRASVRLIEEDDQQGSYATPALHLDEARRVEVRITGAYLPAGVEIEDTPGLNEQAGRSAGALSALGRADLILFVLAADQLLGTLEQAVIDSLAAGYHRNVLFLVNFWDTIEDPAQQEALRQRVHAILGRFPGALQIPSLPGEGDEQAGRGVLPVCYLSALQAVRAQRQRKPAPEPSGIPRLRAVLRDYLGPRSSALLLRARLGRGLRYLDALQPAVARDAAATLGSTQPTGDARLAAREATVAARRQIEALPGATQGAVAQALAALHERRSPGLQRVTALLERAARENGQGQSLQEVRQVLGVELRAVAAQAVAAAQQSIDLLIAQARAAYLGRGLAPPVMDAQVPPLPLALPERASAALLAAILEGAADHIETTLGAALERLQIGLLAALPEIEPPAPSLPAVDAGLLARRAALLALEEDLVRLRDLLQGCLDDT